jgi:hypothetical protein
MAAAYLFHIVSNHPFVDGNKRAGLLAAQVFLDVNGVTLEHDSEAFYALTMGVAEGRIDKAAVAAELYPIRRRGMTAARKCATGARTLRRGWGHERRRSPPSARSRREAHRAA